MHLRNHELFVDLSNGGTNCGRILSGVASSPNGPVPRHTDSSEAVREIDLFPPAGLGWGIHSLIANHAYHIDRWRLSKRQEDALPARGFVRERFVGEKLIDHGNIPPASNVVLGKGAPCKNRRAERLEISSQNSVKVNGEDPC